MKTLEDKIADQIIAHTESELALGYLRYEALRKLKPREFHELHKRNLNGEFFDGMVDKLIVQK